MKEGSMATAQTATSPATKVLEVTDRSFRTDVLASTQPVLVDFGADWCAPCRAIAPFIDAIAAKYDGKVRVATCDVDRNPELANRFDVRSIPTLLLFHDGRVVGRMVGAASRDRIERFVNEALLKG
jgi:thioredoxin 1